jgi:serine/threonine-protein kinase
VDHPNVVDILDSDYDEALGVPFIVMEYLEGESLVDRIKSSPSKRFSPEETLQLLVPVMAALVAAHEKGVIHRDLKPNNIFLVRALDGGVIPKVIDFGIAKLADRNNTVTGDVLGTAAFMAPEQALSSRTVDARADIWSMGVTLYRMLSGEMPYDGEAPVVVQMVQRDPTPLVSWGVPLPADVVAVVDRALRRNPDERFASMREMLAATMACAAYQNVPVSVRIPVSLPPPSAEGAGERPSVPVATPVRAVTPVTPPTPPASRAESVQGAPGVSAPARRTTARRLAPVLVGTVLGMVLLVVGGVLLRRGGPTTGNPALQAVGPTPVTPVGEPVRPNETPTVSAPVVVPAPPIAPPLPEPPSPGVAQTVRSRRERGRHPIAQRTTTTSGAPSAGTPTPPSSPTPVSAPGFSLPQAGPRRALEIPGIGGGSR